MKNEVDENGFFSIDSIYSDIQKLIIEKKKYSQKAVNSAIVSL